MDLGRTIFSLSASAAIALAAQTATTVGYVTPAQVCTTKDAQKPTAAQTPEPNPNWWMGTPQTQMTQRMPSGQNPNDFPMLQTFPTVYTQPVDKSQDGPKTLPVSTCQ